MSLPPHRVCNVIEHVITRHMDDKDRAKFDSELNRPLPGESIEDIEEGPWSIEGMASAFEGAMKTIQ